jgi:protein-L-isoaspartate O-methyltransferase
LAQLAEGGRLVLPLGGREQQMLTVIKKSKGTYELSAAELCVFVPLVSDREVNI